MENQELNVLLRRLSAGEIDARPFIVPEAGDRVYPCYRAFPDTARGTLRLEAEEPGVWRDCLYFDAEADSIRCRREFSVLSSAAFPLRDLGVTFSGIGWDAPAADDYFYHAENARIYEFMTFPVDYDRTTAGVKDSGFDFQAGNRWGDPGTVSEWIGASPYQPFPAILVSNYKVKDGIVFGSLKQETFYHRWLIRHENGKVTLDAFSSAKDTAVLELAPGRLVRDAWYLGRTDEADDIERIFAGYSDTLRSVLPAGYGRSAINRTEMVWGSWNDGVFRNVSEELVLREAAFLHDRFPTVRWIQLDDGYAVYNKSAHGLGVAYEGEDGIDHNKFPGGLRRYTDALRSLGMRPAIWIGGFCPAGTKIREEHPDWFIDYSYRVNDPGPRPLDVSRADVREYMESAAKKLIRDYGFEGVKHDFWSYAFEDSHDLYQNHDRSGYEYRRWWLETVRRELPSDGYLQTGCDIVMANPFLGEYFTNYRYGIDIGGGNWEYVRTTFQWGACCFATHTGDLFTPNSDSVGTFPGLSRREAMFVINYCLATHSMVEIAGLLSRSEDTEMIRILQKAVCNPNNGQDVYFIGFDYRSHTQKAPEMMYFKTPHFCPAENMPGLPERTVALFNLDETAKDYTFTMQDLGLAGDAYILTDVWSGGTFAPGTVFRLEPHESRLFAVTKDGPLGLTDANIRILSAETEAGALVLRTDYAMPDAELRATAAPRSVLYNGGAVPFTAENGLVRFALPGKGTLRLEF